MNALEIQERIDSAIVRNQATIGRQRDYLGMSGIGHPCPRKPWLQWRWAKFETFSARILRLFERGHLEEFRFVHFLRQACFEVQEYDPDTGKQFQFTSCEGHVMGHSDGRVFLPLRKKGEWCVVEMKTHNAKSFNALKKAQSVKVAKHEHYAQCQRYMEAEGLKNTLYMAVNKDTDAMYVEIVPYDEGTVAWLFEREKDLVWRTTAPDCISDNPDFWRCRFCVFQGICHFNELVNRTCRTCKHSKPVENGKWLCIKKNKHLTYKQQMNGCKKGFSVL